MLREEAASISLVGVLLSMSENRVLAAWGRGEEVEKRRPEELKSDDGWMGLELRSGVEQLGRGRGRPSGDGLGGRGSRVSSNTSSMLRWRRGFSTNVIFWMERTILSMSETGVRGG